MFRIYPISLIPVLLFVLCSFQSYGGDFTTMVKVDWSDSLSMSSSFQIQNDQTEEALVGAVLKLSDPLRHGVVFRYIADDHGFVRFAVQSDQTYFIQIEKEGFEAMEFKIRSHELAALKNLKLKSEVPVKSLNFADELNQLINFVSIDVFSPLETHLCWLHPSKQNSRQIVGFSHNALIQVLTFSDLSY